MLTTGLAGSVMAADGSPAIQTDKHQYKAGETVTITGAGFLPETAITLTVNGPDGEPGPYRITDEITGVVSDSAGAFTATYTAPGIPGNYVVTASDGANTAICHFADPPEVGIVMEGYNIPTTGGFKLEWITGMLGKSYDEGEWVPYQTTIYDIQAVYPNMVGMPDIVIGWDFTGGNSPDSPRFGDLVRDIQVGLTKLTNAQGFPTSNGTAYVIGTLADANVPQNDPDENEWLGFTLCNLPNSQVNVPIPIGSTPDVDDEVHAFVIHASDLPSYGIPASTDTFYIYYQIHESRTFVWNNGLQAGYDVPPTDAWGGYLYSAAPYNTDKREGSGFVSGASGHVHNEGVGGSKDVPLPVPPEPEGQICGYKFNDADASGTAKNATEYGIGNWTVYIIGQLAEGFTFSTSVLTDSNGHYCFTALTDDVWYLAEDKARTSPVETFWSQTYPNVGTAPFGQATPMLSSLIPFTLPGDPDLGAWGYSVVLNETSRIQNNVDFGNVGKGCLTVHKTATIPACVVGTPPNVDFTVHVVGPSYPSGIDLVFHLVNGVITNNDQTLPDITGGNYTVSEPTQPASWNLTSITPAQPINIAAGSSCGANIVTVTDTFQPGCLTVHKTATIPACVVGTPPNVDFTVHVVGPSYPSGTDLVFHLVNGVITNNDQTLTCILPGAYTVSEPTQPASWNLTSILPVQPINIAAGSSCGANVVTVTDTFQPGCLKVTKVVDLDEYKFASSANSTFVITVTGPSYPTGYNLTFYLVNGNVTGYDCTSGDTACLCCLIPGSYTVAETPPAGWGPVNITGSPANVEAGDTCEEGAAVITVTNTLLIPHTTINITADVYETTIGGNVWLYISDTNDGAVNLTNPSVSLLVGANPPIELVKGDAYWSVGPTTWAQSPGTPNGDVNNNGIMDVGETWYWAVQVTLSATTDITVNGHGTDPLGNPVDGPTYIDETDTITVKVGGATRTWGFWKTHLYLVQWMFNATAPGSPHIASIDMGNWTNLNGALQTHIIDSVCRYMGLMWSDQSKNSDRTMRKDIDNARIHAAHQALAAIMNSLMPGGAPLPAGINLTSIAYTLTNGTKQQIQALGSALAGYNEGGEGVALDPSLPPTGKVSGNIANPQGAKTAGAACMSYWNTPKKR
jgi:hypothetical protein